VLRLERIEGLNLHVRDVDLLDGTPILDLKPYVPYTDAFPESGSGWLDPSAPDPKLPHPVTFSAKVEAQLAWLAGRIALPLRERIETTLQLGPQPHPYRRIKCGKDGLMQLAVQDWRVAFRAEGRDIQVLSLRPGYQQAQLEKSGTTLDDLLRVHREFVAQFPDR
jgi:tRNA (adenine37-N6)-methyltransferase